MIRWFLFLSFFFLSLLTNAASEEDWQLLEAQKHYSQNNYIKAQEEYLKALSKAEKSNNIENVLKCQWGIAVCHYYLHDRKSASKWFYEYLNTVQKNDLDSLLSSAYYYIGVLYIEEEIVDSAMKYMRPAIELMKKEKKYDELSRCYSVLAELYINTTKKPEEIEPMLIQAEKYANISGNKGMQAFASLKWYNYLYRVKKDYKRALPYVIKSEYLYKELKNREAILNVYRAKAECLIKLGDTTAYDYIDKWFYFKDSIFNLEKVENMAKYEKLYETEKKEIQIKHQQEILTKEREANRLYLIISGIIILLVIFLFIVYRIIHKHKTEILLKEQQEITIREIFNAEQKERIRIARDLHDSIGQKLSVMKMLLPQADDNPDVQKISKYIDETANEVRTISHNLIPEILSLGIVKAIHDLIDKINESKKIKIEYDISQDLNKIKLPKQTELSIYRIVQEILNNIIRHSQTNKIYIELKYNNHFIQVNIEDNGVGFDTNNIELSEGIGWKNIFARIKLINGNIQIRSEKNKGSHFLINIPAV